ncbi:MAG: class I SAM-dependent methyltransferase [Micromonosporaceae bacterium]
MLLPGRDAARTWITRWDRQQENYMPDREDRFTALIDALRAGVERPDPLVVDLGCGPGSLARRLLDRLPEATVIAIDGDPLLLGLGRAAHGNRARLRFVEGDLRAAGWSSALGADRPVDAVVSTTALHWLSGAELRRMYAEAASLLRPGGLLLNGDHFVVDEPGLALLDRGLMEAQRRRTVAGGGHGDGRRGENWPQWWAAVAADPALADLNAERERRWAEAANHGGEGGRLATHLAALDAAGFTQIGTLWQHGENRLLCAFRPRC